MFSACSALVRRLFSACTAPVRRLLSACTAPEFTPSRSTNSLNEKARIHRARTWARIYGERMYCDCTALVQRLYNAWRHPMALARSRFFLTARLGFFLTALGISSACMALCRSRRELPNAYVRSKFGFDTTENSFLTATLDLTAAHAYFFIKLPVMGPATITKLAKISR